MRPSAQGWEAMLNKISILREASDKQESEDVDCADSSSDENIDDPADGQKINVWDPRSTKQISSRELASICMCFAISMYMRSVFSGLPHGKVAMYGVWLTLHFLF